MCSRIACLAFLLVILEGGSGRVAAADFLTETRLYECTPTRRPPKIDGRLDDICWQEAEVADTFTRTLTAVDSPPSVQTHFRILYDEQNLYLGIRCDEPNPQKIKMTVTEADNASVCGDDCIEIFCQPNPERLEYYHFAVNPAGTRYDGRAFDASWNGQWQAAVSIRKDAWQVECAIALASFPDRCGIWRFNVNREVRSTSEVELHCWSNTFGGFHSPERFGTLIFAGPFANLRRGYLMQAARYARLTLEKQNLFQARKREIEQMRSVLPAHALIPFASLLKDLTRDEEELVRKYSTMKELSLRKWKAFDAALQGLLQRCEKVYWPLKFEALFTD